MNANEPLLPKGFEDLEPWIADWALPLNMQRYTKRTHSTMEELRAFYDAVEPRAAEALALLDAYPIEEIDGPEARLMYLMLALVDVSLAVEVYQEPVLKLSPAPERFAVRMERMTFN
jgi:hypothetical protein